MASSSEEERMVEELSKKPEPEEKSDGTEAGCNGNPDNVPPEIYTKGRNWQRNRTKMVIRYGLWDIEKREIQQKEEEAKRAAERKEVKARMVMKKGAEFVLVNYESGMQRRVQFPVLPYGWRLHSIKMVNHSLWILTVYSYNKLRDLISALI